MNEHQREMLQAAVESRLKEIAEYQVNINNFERAIQIIGDDAEMQDFKKQLEGLLKSNKHEQRKAQIMLEAVKIQIKE